MKHTQIIEHFGMFDNKINHQASQMFYVIAINLYIINRLERKVYETK